MNRFTIATLNAALLLTACSAVGTTASPDDDRPATALALIDEPGAAAATLPPAPTADPTGADPAVARVTEAHLAAFVAAVEAAVAGSVHAGAIHQSPETYIATAQLFCARLSAEDDLEAILDEYLTTLSGTTLDTASPEDTLLLGAVLGAGVETLCPENANHL